MSPLCSLALGVPGGARVYPSPQLRRSLRPKIQLLPNQPPQAETGEKGEAGGWCFWVSVQNPQSPFPAQRLPSALGHGTPCWPHHVL